MLIVKVCSDQLIYFFMLGNSILTMSKYAVILDLCPSFLSFCGFSFFRGGWICTFVVMITSEQASVGEKMRCRGCVFIA